MGRAAEVLSDHTYGKMVFTAVARKHVEQGVRDAQNSLLV